MIKVQEALKAAIETINQLDIYKSSMGLDFYRISEKVDLDAVLLQCKAALADIEKCYGGTTPVREPVAECLICATGNDLPEGEYCRACGRENNMTNLGRAIKYARGGNSVPTKPLLYTSPQPRDWVELSDEILGEITRAWAIDIERTPRNLANTISDELKQLNTKG